MWTSKRPGHKSDGVHTVLICTNVVRVCHSVKRDTGYNLLHTSSSEELPTAVIVQRKVRAAGG